MLTLSRFHDIIVICRYNPSDMRRFISAVCVWQICVFGFIVISLALRGDHIWSKNDWSKDDLLWIGTYGGCGLVIVTAVALFSHSRSKVGGAVVGALCGISPSVLLSVWAFIARPGFEASAGTVGVALMVALPSAIGGAAAGLICARRTPTT